jgi:hypothetical protein
VVDVESTVIEFKWGFVPDLGDDYIYPPNLKKDRYEFHGGKCKIYRWYMPEGEDRKCSVYDQDESSIIILFEPESWRNIKFSKPKPDLEELAKISSLGAIKSIDHLLGFEFVDENNIRLFHIRLDAKGNPLRQFSGIHLIRE